MKAANDGVLVFDPSERAGALIAALTGGGVPVSLVREPFECIELLAGRQNPMLIALGDKHLLRYLTSRVKAHRPELTIVVIAESPVMLEDPILVRCASVILVRPGVAQIIACVRELVGSILALDADALSASGASDGHSDVHAVINVLDEVGDEVGALGAMGHGDNDDIAPSPPSSANAPALTETAAIVEGDGVERLEGGGGGGAGAGEGVGGEGDDRIARRATAGRWAFVDTGTAILGRLFGEGRSGRLFDADGRASGTLWLKDGEAVWVALPDGDAGLYRRLVDAQLVPGGREAPAGVEGQLLPQLIDLGLLDRAAARLFLIGLVRQCVVDFLASERVTAVFINDARIDGLLAGVGVNIFGLTVDRWQRLLLRGEGVSLDDTLFSTVTATPALPAGRSRVARFCEGVELLALLESGPTVAEVIATLAMGRELGFAIVLSLRDAGLIAMDRAEEPTALLAPPL